MGKSSVEIEHDIERQRERLTARISRLDRRVRDDIDSVKDEARERARRAQEKAREAAERTRDTAAEARAGEHPGAVTGIAFGAGAVLGWVTGREGDEEQEHEVAKAVERERREEDDRSRLAGIASSLFHSALSYAGSQGTGLAKTAAKKGATTAVKSVRSGEDPEEAHRREHERLRSAETAELTSTQPEASRRADELSADRDALLGEVHQV